MANKLNIRLDGIPELEFKLSVLEKSVGKKFLRQAVRAAAKPIRDEAARLAPRRTSPPPRGSNKHHPLGKELHRNIKVRSAGRQQGSTLAVQVATAPHGLLQELGTRFHAAQPFLRPAFDSQKANATEEFRKKLGALIEDAVRQGR